jgi:hypothetical protein
MFFAITIFSLFSHYFFFAFAADAFAAQSADDFAAIDLFFISRYAFRRHCRFIARRRRAMPRRFHAITIFHDYLHFHFRRALMAPPLSTLVFSATLSFHYYFTGCHYFSFMAGASSTLPDWPFSLSFAFISLSHSQLTGHSWPGHTG